MQREFARQLRRNLTDAERRLWRVLRYRQVGGWKFRRQAPVGKYILDFVCFEQKLVIELDGGQHAQRVVEDAERTAWLESQGFRVLRFWNPLVFEELEAIVEVMWRALGETPHPNPPPQGGRGPGRRTKEKRAGDGRAADMQAGVKQKECRNGAAG